MSPGRRPSSRSTRALSNEVALANGVLNGILCAEFYWTVSLMFGLSNSALPVGIYHHLMYSMPLFVKSYDEAVEAGPIANLARSARSTAR